jgi:hypothetical protein
MFSEDSMKYASLLPIGFVVVVLTVQLQAASSTPSIPGGTFADLSTWTCPNPAGGTGNCSTLAGGNGTGLDVEPYWMQLSTALNMTTGDGTSALRIGAWNSANPGFISESATGIDKNINYKISLSWGEYDIYAGYTSPDFAAGNGVNVLWNGANVASWTNDLNTTNAPQGTVTAWTTHTIVVGGPTSGPNGTSIPIEFTAYDRLEDVILDNLTIAITTDTVGSTSQFVQFQLGDGTLVDEVPLDSTPEPGTFGLMGIVSIVLFAATKKARA